MNFLSVRYLLFLALATLLCCKLKPKQRNAVLLLMSYLFYSCFHAVYALYLLAATFTTYFCAIFIERKFWGRRRLWLTACLVLDLGMLFFFKYFNFSMEIAARSLSLAGISAEAPFLRLLLPVGISFYLFQITGYLIDVYRGELKAEENPVDFALFASFFPGLTSGPIQRAGFMLPQYKEAHPFDFGNMKSGAMQFLWGAFKKMVLADQLAILVNTAYINPAACSGIQLLFAAAAYSVQIYCDFSAYSDMAIGSAKIMGFDIPKNFDCPYFATSVKEFWRRWHISLSTWFRDYLYFPLGGSRRGKPRVYLNLMIVFIVSGLWHGAALNFAAWGMLHGLFQVAGYLSSPLRGKLRRFLRISEQSRLLTVLRCLFTFLLVTAAWVFFRAGSIQDAVYILCRIASIPFSGGFYPTNLTALGLSRARLLALFAFTALLFAADWGENKFHFTEKLNKSAALRFSVYFVLIAAVLIFGYYGAGFNPQDFVYFKF